MTRNLAALVAPSLPPLLFADAVEKPGNGSTDPVFEPEWPAQSVISKAVADP